MKNVWYDIIFNYELFFIHKQIITSQVTGLVHVISIWIMYLRGLPIQRLTSAPVVTGIRGNQITMMVDMIRTVQPCGGVLHSSTSGMMITALKGWLLFVSNNNK